MKVRFVFVLKLMGMGLSRDTCENGYLTKMQSLCKVIR